MAMPLKPHLLVAAVLLLTPAAQSWLPAGGRVFRGVQVTEHRLESPDVPRRRVLRRGGAARLAGAAQVRSMILGETPIIETTGINSRRISASIVIQRPPEEVWRILTDYDRLAVHVPNLVQSKRLPHPSGGIRLYQEGAQKIFGFDFSASLVMDMEEFFGPEQERRHLQRKIKFWLVQSQMLAVFDGEWVLQPHSRRLLAPTPETITAGEGRGETRGETLAPRVAQYTTRLIYSVNVTPKGMVPVPAIEWRIREDVPTNLRAVKNAVERMPPRPVDELLAAEASLAARLAP